VSGIKHVSKTRYSEVVTKETPFETAGDLYAALAFLTLEGVDLDRYSMPQFLFLKGRSITIERLPDE
jgi:hypothetical protein